MLLNSLRLETRSAFRENSDAMLLVVGITGPVASGKSTVAACLTQMATDRGIRSFCYSLGEEIRNELRRRGIQATRDAQREIGNLVRAKVSNGAWASVVASRVEEDLSRLCDEPILILVDGIRNRGEVHEFRAFFGESFRLLAVTAPPNVLSRNLIKRRRKDESERTLRDEHELATMIRAEMGEGEPDYGHHVAACLELADLPPIQNDSSEDELRNRVRQVAIQHLFPELIESVAPTDRDTRWLGGAVERMVLFAGL